MYFSPMVTTTLAQPPLTLDELEAFTEGDCWALALELHRRGGFPLVMVACARREAEPWELLRWCHVVVQVGELYLDARGLTTGPELLSHWGTVASYYTDPLSLIPLPDQDAFEQATCEQERFYDEDAGATAARLLSWLSLQLVTPA